MKMGNGKMNVIVKCSIEIDGKLDTDATFGSFENAIGHLQLIRSRRIREMHDGDQIGRNPPHYTCDELREASYGFSMEHLDRNMLRQAADTEEAMISIREKVESIDVNDEGKCQEAIYELKKMFKESEVAK